MKPLLILFALVMVFGCHTNPVGPDLSSPQDTPISSQSGNTILKDSAKPLTAKLDTTPLPPEHYTRKGPEIGFDLCDSERVGELHIRMSKEQVIKLLGQAESKTDTVRTGADGLIHQDWVYKKKGIWLDMAGEDMSKLSIDGLMIYAPCAFKTRRRIGIGSTVKEIGIAYRKAIKMAEDSLVPPLIIVGSAYGGIQFTIDKDKVDTLFIGATAE